MESPSQQINTTRSNECDTFMQYLSYILGEEYSRWLLTERHAD